MRGATGLRLGTSRLAGPRGDGMLAPMWPSARGWCCKILLLSLVSCARAPYVWVYDLPEAELRGESASLGPGDRLFVFVRDQPTLSAEVVVAEDATIALPVVGQITVGGASPAQVAQAVTKGLTGVLEKPVVNVSLVTRRPAEIVVIGEVRNPGRFEVPAGTRLVDALALAGGLNEFANRRRLFVVRQGSAAGRIRFRYGEVLNGEVASSRFVLVDGDVIVAE